MTILTRLEGIYLNILRVVILLLATLLLFATVAAGVFVIPRLLPEAKSVDARTLVQGDTLADFKSFQKGEMRPTTAPAQETVGGQKIDSRIKAAAAALTSYVRDQGHELGPEVVEQFLMTKQASLPEELQGDYADSLLKLTTALRTSRETMDIEVLITWHYNKFVEAEGRAAEQAAAQAAKKAARTQLAIVAGSAAAAAFGLFLLVIFVFVLVKMERNLRVVAVRLINGAAAEQ
jgi:hypothetical protein